MFFMHCDYSNRDVSRCPASSRSASSGPKAVGRARAEVAIAYGNQYELTESEAKEFWKFWNDLERAQKKFIAAAIRRFGFAGERRRPDDRLIDMMIAAESFFLNDAGDPVDHGELTYRMAIQFAFLAEFPDYSRSDLFKQMKDAYRVRSAIVHGGTPRPDHVKSKEGKITLEQFVDLIEQLLRVTIKSGVKKAAANEPGFGDWEHLILGSPVPEGESCD
jgi:hypothetical protein